MTMDYDLLIKHGRVVDGSGLPSYVADVAIKDGKIVDIGRLNGSARRTIDADGLVVSPGFIDPLGTVRHLRAATWRDLDHHGQLRPRAGAGESRRRRRDR
jgi:N-acyl-D-aspartate/D-glutamate deacylase